MKKPKIPMVPQDLPQQRLAIVKDLPQRPDIWDGVTAYGGRGFPPDAILKRPPRNPIYLFQAEWAWSPANSRLNAFYLNKGRKHWILYSNYIDYDFDDDWTWNPAGCVPIKQASMREAAIWLMIDYMMYDAAHSEVDEWHMINEVGYLSIADIRAISRVIWS